MAPIISKYPVPATNLSGPGTEGTSKKNQGSKFAQVIADSRRQPGVDAKGSAAAPTSVDSAKAPPATPSASQLQIGKQLSVNGTHLDKLKKRVAELPQSSSTTDLQNKLLGVERQYRHLDSTFRSLPPNANPMQLVSLQQNVYNVSESVSALSKMVDSATSTVKTVMQTQV